MTGLKSTRGQASPSRRRSRKRRQASEALRLLSPLLFPLADAEAEAAPLPPPLPPSGTSAKIRSCTSLGRCAKVVEPSLEGSRRSNGGSSRAQRGATAVVVRGGVESESGSGSAGRGEGGEEHPYLPPSTSPLVTVAIWEKESEDTQRRGPPGERSERRRRRSISLPAAERRWSHLLFFLHFLFVLPGDSQLLETSAGLSQLDVERGAARRGARGDQGEGRGRVLLLHFWLGLKTNEVEFDGRKTKQIGFVAKRVSCFAFCPVFCYIIFKEL